MLTSRAAASSRAAGSRPPAARRPSAMAPRTCPAICRNRGSAAAGSTRNSIVLVVYEQCYESNPRWLDRRPALQGRLEHGGDVVGVGGGRVGAQLHDRHE